MLIRGVRKLRFQMCWANHLRSQMYCTAKCIFSGVFKAGHMQWGSEHHNNISKMPAECTLDTIKMWDLRFIDWITSDLRHIAPPNATFWTLQGVAYLWRMCFQYQHIQNTCWIHVGHHKNLRLQIAWQNDLRSQKCFAAKHIILDISGGGILSEGLNSTREPPKCLLDAYLTSLKSEISDSLIASPGFSDMFHM